MAPDGGSPLRLIVYCAKATDRSQLGLEEGRVEPFGGPWLAAETRSPPATGQTAGVLRSEQRLRRPGSERGDVHEDSVVQVELTSFAPRPDTRHQGCMQPIVVEVYQCQPRRHTRGRLGPSG